MAQESGSFADVFRAEFLDKMPYIMDLVQEDASVQLTIQAMDAMFGLECTWHRGLKTYAETVLTFLPAHRPFYIQNEPLRLYILATLRACQILESIVRQANVVEGEEFFRSTHSILPEPEDDYDELSAKQIIEAIQETLEMYAGLMFLTRRLRRVMVWLRIVDTIYQKGPIMMIDELIDEALQATISVLDDEHDTQGVDKIQLGIYPSMANCFLTGCPRSTRLVPDLTHQEAVREHANLLLSLKILTELANVEGSFKLERLVRQLWATPFHPILASILFLCLNENRLIQVTFVQLESSTVQWLGLPKHVRTNIAPISSHLMDVIQISCQSMYTQHANLHRLIRSMHEYFSRPDLNRGLYVLDYLRWWKHLASVRAILLGFELEIYERYEFAEAFWVLSKLYNVLEWGRKSRFASLLSYQLAAEGHDVPAEHLYRDCRFTRRWQHLLPCQSDLSDFESEASRCDDSDIELVGMEQTLCDAFMAAQKVSWKLLNDLLGPVLESPNNAQNLTPLRRRHYNK